jgi:predicted TIM-barrel fold metal-dependent hydrolase
MDNQRARTHEIVDGHVHFRDIRWTEALLQLMDAVPLTAINLVSTPNARTVNQNPELIYLKAHYPAHFYASGGLDYVPALADPARMSDLLAEQVRRLKEIGFDGLKLIAGKPTARARWGVPFDAPGYEGMWATLQELRMPVVCHVADPEEFWDPERVPAWARAHGWYYGAGGFPTKESLYAEIDRVLERHPALQIIFAHFYFLSADLDRAGRFLDAHPTVCLDITPGAEMYNHFTRQHDAARTFFLQYQDRIVYGTDTNTGSIERSGIAAPLSYARYVRSFLEDERPFAPSPLIPHWLEDDLDAIRPLALPESALNKIYHANFQRLYGARPVTLNRDAALEELARIAVEVDARSESAEQAEAEGNMARTVLNALTTR